jgi:hypothetical protein
MPHNDSKLIGIFGDRGSGKTLLLFYLIIKSNLPVFSNFHFYTDSTKKILNPRYNELHPEELLHMDANPKIIAITEAYEYFESRLGMGSFERYNSYMLFQSRKKRAHYIIDTQLDSTLDNRFTKLCDLIIVAEAEQEGFCYYCSNKKIIREFFITFKIAEKFWDLYDSWEIITTPQVERLGEQISLQNRTKLKEKLNELTIKFKEEYGELDNKKITHSLVDSFLLDKDESDVYSSFLYSWLQKPKK